MPNTPSDEQFIQRRMLLAAVLSAAVMGGYIYLAPRPEPAQQETTEVGTTQVPAPASSVPQGTARAEAAAEPSGTSGIDPASQLVEAISEQTVKVETDAFVIEFTNRGATVKSWELKNFKDSIGEPLDLVHQGGAARFGHPFRLVRPGGEPIVGSDEALFTVNSGPPTRRAPETLVFEYAKNGLQIRKVFGFEAEGHIVRVATEVSEGGRPQRHLFEWGGGFGDTAQVGNTVHSQTFYFDDGDIQYTPAADAEDERISHSGPFPFVGIADLFFTAAVIPEPGSGIRLETSAVEIVPLGAEPGDREQFVAAAFGGETQNSVRLYVGPKSRETLASVEGVGSAFGRIVDFGFFSFIAEPIFWTLRWVYGNMVSNWGWSIVIVTILINTILFPLKYKSTKSMRKMQQLQPLVKQINNKYKGVKMRDPRKAKQNEELQALYKKYKANPMGGCLPILLQMPFFFAFYKLLTVAIEMRQAEWLWVSDLSNPETLAIRVLPLAMVGTQFWSQSLMPTPTTDAMQARLMKFMPLIFGFIFYQFSAGLVLYWLTTNCVGIVQQLILNRLPTEALVIEAGPKRGRGGKRGKGRKRRKRGR